ncbi:hypothetical protein HYT45_01130 [Candidatus Uhrbacteria bacterium]|nr:hypothetical protein [Candidatus Uhrbacteria bacterium]
MKYVLGMAAVILFSFSLSLADEPPVSRYAGVCARRCRSRTNSIIDATVVHTVLRKRTREKVYLLSTGNSEVNAPAVVCGCESRLVRHRTRADRENTALLARECNDLCRAGTRLYPDVLIVSPDGSEHRESVGILQYESPIACLCTGIPVDVLPPVPPRRHPER